MNLKTLLIIFFGLLAVAGAVVVMSISSGSSTSFEGGANDTRLPRAIPEGRANPFDVVPADEADNRATANNQMAADAIATTQTKAYTAAPVIQIEGTSGDATDPMADRLVEQEKVETIPVQTGFAVPVEPIDSDIEVTTAPEVDYKVQEPAAAEPAAPPTPDPSTLSIMMGLTRGNAGPRVVIDNYDQGRDRGASPMQAQEFR